MRGLRFSLPLAGALATTAFAACSGQPGTMGVPHSGGMTSSMAVGRALPVTTLTVDATETVGIDLSGQEAVQVKHYGKVLGYFPGSTKAKSQTVTIPVGSQVQFENLDTAYSHTAALLGDATKKHAKWPKTFTGGSQASAPGTDISTSGFNTGTLTSGKTSSVYAANVPGFYMFGCMFHYVLRGMRTVIIVH